MAHQQINYGGSTVNVYVPGQLLVFGSMMFCADSTGHLASIDNYAQAQIITFGGLEYTVDLHGKLVLSGRTPDRLGDLTVTGGSTPEPISLEGVGFGTSASPEDVT
jgi:hypothetical protein